MTRLAILNVRNKVQWEEYRFWDYLLVLEWHPVDTENDCLWKRRVDAADKEQAIIDRLVDEVSKASNLAKLKGIVSISVMLGAGR
jgi:hypothetical protein